MDYISRTKSSKKREVKITSLFPCCNITSLTLNNKHLSSSLTYFFRNGRIYSVELVSTCPQLASKWISADGTRDKSLWADPFASIIISSSPSTKRTGMLSCCNCSSGILANAVLGCNFR